MVAGLEAYDGRVLLVISGDDLTAAEFNELATKDARWRRVLSRDTVVRRELPTANHTFSRREWRDEVARLTSEWLRS